MIEARHTLAALLCLTAALSCQLPLDAPPDPAALEALRSQPAAVLPIRLTAELDLTSAAMSGLFRATVVAAGGAAPFIRMQWHGGVGEKVLDLAAGPEGFSGYIPLAAIGIASGWSDPPPRHILSFLACSLLEQVTPLSASRVVASRQVADGWELQIAPVVPGLRLRAEIARDGTLRARRYAWRGVGWTERFDPHRFESKGFVLLLRDETVTPLAAEPSPDLFRLDLPPGARR